LEIRLIRSFQSKPSDVLGLGPSIILFHLKAYTVTFYKSLESRHIDGRIVNKYVPTLVLTDETKSLLLIKPFYSSLWHSTDLPLKPFNYAPRPEKRQNGSQRAKPACEATKNQSPYSASRKPYESAFEDVKEKEAICNPNSRLEAMGLIENLRGRLR
jgi:hypothetical protein